MILSKCCDAEVKFGMVDDRTGHGMHEETECSNCGALFPDVYDDEEDQEAQNEDPGPEYDSAGFTEEDSIVDDQYRNYVDTVKQNIDKADGILKSGTECMSYSYMSKKGFAMRMKTDPEFAKQWENWLFPGEPLHDPDQEDKIQPPLQSKL